MYQTLMGKEAFRQGMDLYFQRHDGQAVTCDDFLSAMRDANDARAELEGFERWWEGWFLPSPAPFCPPTCLMRRLPVCRCHRYSQAGTPVLTVRSEYDAEQHTFTLHCK